MVTLLFAGLNSYADCYGRLTQDYSRDSYAYQLSEDAVDYDLERGSPEFARQAVMAVGQKIGCEAADFGAEKMAESTVSCRDLVPNLRASRVCYVESQHGYFLVSVDMLENINIVFNRFD